MTVSMFSIGEAARASGLNAKTIRYYEQIALIPPARRANRAARTGGNRIYSEVDLNRLRFIHGARLIGLPLDDVRDLLAAADGGCPGDQPLYHEKLTEHLQAIDDRIGHLLSLRRAVGNLMSRERGGGAGACVMPGCDCMDAPELSSGTATPVLEPMNVMMSNGGGRNGKGAA
jgi:DNA-binding transcriptional MerR regulator